MEINVAQLLKLPIGTTRTYQFDEDVEGVEESGGFCHVRGDVKLLRTKEGILTRGILETLVEGMCSRCLETVTSELQLHIEEEYYPSVDVDTGYSLDVPPDSVGFTISQNHVLELDEAIRQYILLSRPMQPLCRADCAGLCPECGANLNLEQCDCQQQDFDGPLATFGKALGTSENLSVSNERS